MTIRAALRFLGTAGVVICLASTGCVRREGRNAECVWPEVNAGPLDLSRGGDARHLREDVELAEDLAVRYMDAQHRMPPAQRKAGPLGAVMNACRNSLLKQISTSHAVAPGEIIALFGRRSLATDLMVIIPFYLLYGLLAALMAGWVLRRYPPDESMAAALVMLALCSLACGIGGLLLGEQWSITAENIRIGTGHLSYRADRIPWVQHRMGFFAGCVAVFWGAAAVLFWQRGRRLRA